MKFISPDERQRWIANNKQNLNGRYISVKDIEAQNNTMESSIEERKKLGRRLTKRQRSWLNSKKDFEGPHVQSKRIMTRKQRKLLTNKET